ncbi:MAG: hypothetical protein BWY49_01017 [Candidatus Omnitrophica bacterium ADurb.Bin314]|nr:MAG: hypothetical protein BWY49_01017 [Candidatus Omnitrophica bacterium ADurb.Bin314]
MTRGIFPKAVPSSLFVTRCSARVGKFLSRSSLMNLLTTLFLFTRGKSVRYQSIPARIADGTTSVTSDKAPRPSVIAKDFPVVARSGKAYELPARKETSHADHNTAVRTPVEAADTAKTSGTLQRTGCLCVSRPLVNSSRASERPEKESRIASGTRSRGQNQDSGNVFRPSGISERSALSGTLTILYMPSISVPTYRLPSWTLSSQISLISNTSRGPFVATLTSTNPLSFIRIWRRL